MPALNSPARAGCRLTQAEAVSYYDVNGKRFAVEPGEYEVRAGGSSRGIRPTARFRVP